MKSNTKVSLLSLNCEYKQLRAGRREGPGARAPLEKSFLGGAKVASKFHGALAP